MSERLFSQRDLNRIFSHLSPRTLHHWAVSGVLRSSGEELNGRGKARLYSLEDVYLAALIDELSSNNMPLELIKTVLEKLIHNHGGILKNIDCCLVIFKHIAGAKGWRNGPSVGKYSKEELVRIIDRPILLAPVWDFPCVIIISLEVIAKRVKQLADDADVTL